MTRSRTFFLTAVGIGLAFLMGARVVAPRTAKIATVDMESVMDEYVKETGQFEALRTKYNSRLNALAVLRETIQSMEQESEVFPRGSDQFVELRTQIAIKKAEYQYQKESADASYDREQAKLMREAYQKAVDVIERYANEKGVDLVMLRQSDLAGGLSMAEVSSQIVVRGVLFGHSDLDITNDIKSRMK